MQIASDARAHAILMTFIRHEAKISVGPRNIDVTIELTFHEYPSLAERRRMDRDHDEAITEVEIREYLAGLASILREGVTIGVDDRPLRVIPLYEPQVDFLGAPNVAPSHHTLRLSYFARTPDWLAAGSRIRIEDRLWSDAPRIDVLNASGADGFQVIPDDVNGPATAPEAAAGPRVISLSCQAAPAAVPGTPAVAASTDQAGMSKQDKLVAGVGAVLLLMIVAGTAGGIRRYVVRNMRAGGQT